METKTELSFEPIIGQERAKRKLRMAIDNSRLAHSYLFSGPAGAGKAAMAIHFARILLCTGDGAKPCGRCRACIQMRHLGHPNFTLLFARPRSASEQDLIEYLRDIATRPYAFARPWANPFILIEDVRKLRNEMSLKSYFGANRVVILLEAHEMNQEAANALLKLLEEPPQNSYFVLTSSSPERLLATIHSRCQQIQFHPLATADVEKGLAKMTDLEPARRLLVARMSRGNMRRALEAAAEGIEARKAAAIDLLRAAFLSPSQMALRSLAFTAANDRRAVRETLELMQLWLRDAMLLHHLGEKSPQKYMTNLDDQETLQKFVEKFPEFDYNAAISAIEESINILDRNGQSLLVVIVMLSKLRAAARKTKASALA